MNTREKVPNDINESFSAARALLVLEQYRQLCEMAEGICRIVPLKGVSLLRSVYAEHLDRDAGDIDILVYPAQKALQFINKLVASGYCRQFNHLTDSSALLAKKKIALRGRNPLETDVDIHLGFITKKIFRGHCGNFNKDALDRCVTVDNVESVMDPVDEWLFLAHHACFHQFDNQKWIRDLRILASGFTSMEITRLRNRAKKYGMTRIVRACQMEMDRGYGDKIRIFPRPLSTRSERRFDSVVDGMLHKTHTKIMKRVFRAVWEVVFVDSRIGRIGAACRLMFPSHGELKAVYRTSSSFMAEILRIPHLFFSGGALSVFIIYNCFIYPLSHRSR